MFLLSLLLKCLKHANKNKLSLISVFFFSNSIYSNKNDNIKPLVKF